MSLAPLSERVIAPATAPLPEHEAVAEWRAMTLADVDALMPTVHAADAIDHPTWATPRDDIEDFFEMSSFVPETDSLIGVDADGRIVAYSFVNRASTADTRVQVYVAGTVHPELRGRGIGRQLLDWGIARAQQMLAESDSTLPAWILNYQYENVTAARGLARRAGMREERWFTSMNRVLADDIPQTSLPEGLRLVQYTPELSAATMAARNDSFRDHWGSQPVTAERWDSFVTNPFFRHDLSWVVVDDADTVVAFALGNVLEDDFELQGYSSVYIALIGVVRAHRGKHLAPAVIAAQLRAAREAGLERADLDVDSESPTGANRLYENLGFTATEREVAYVIAY